MGERRERIAGTCKWFNSVMGYGFLKSDKGNDEYFVHQSAIKSEGFRNLAQGEEVEFSIEIEPDTKKQKAIDVTGPGGADVKGEDLRTSSRQSGGGGRNGQFPRNNFNGANRQNFGGGGDRGFERRTNEYPRRNNDSFPGDRRNNERYGERRYDENEQFDGGDRSDRGQNANFANNRGGFRGGRGGFESGRGRGGDRYNGSNRTSENRDYEAGWRES